MLSQPFQRFRWTPLIPAPQQALSSGAPSCTAPTRAVSLQITPDAHAIPRCPLFQLPMSYEGAQQPFTPSPLSVLRADKENGAHPTSTTKTPSSTSGSQSGATSNPSKKARVEREYSVEEFRAMLKAVLKGRSAEGAAADAGFSSATSSLKRYRKHVLQVLPTDAPLSARLAYVDTLDLKRKGNKDLLARRIFSDDELDFFEQAIIMYADLGWPLQYRL